MKFRNKTEDTRYGTGLGYVQPGATVEVDADTAAGLVLQCGDDGAWEPVDDEAKQAVAKATGVKRAAKKSPAKKAAKKAAPKAPNEPATTPDDTTDDGATAADQGEK